MVFFEKKYEKKTACQEIVRFYALFRFYRNVPPPVYPAAYSFEFLPCDITLQAQCICFWLRIKTFYSYTDR